MQKVVFVDTGVKTVYPTGVMYRPTVAGKIGLVAVALVVVVGATILLTAADSRMSEIPTEDGRRALELANRWRDLEPDIHSYVDASAVYFRFPSEKLVQAPLPADSMVIAAAPYINYTHPCAIHAVSSCQAELANEPIRVTVIDESGQTVKQKETTTMDNGFVELWLPRGSQYTLHFEARGRSVETTARTYSDSRTCLTNLQLERHDENEEDHDA